VICSASSRGGKEVGGGFNETERDSNLLQY